MFKATIADVAVFRDSIIAIAELIDEGIFKITKNGMSLLAADRAMVSVVDFKLPATVFEEYKVEKDQTLGVNISNFVSVIKRAKPEDKLTFELKGNTLEVRMLNGGARKFVVPLLDIKGEEIKDKKVHGKILLSVPIVMLDMITLVFQGVKSFVFDLPA